MSTKKFIISLACALIVLIVLSVFTVVFVSAKTHRYAVLGTWVALPDENTPIEEQVMTSYTFNDDDTYEKTTLSINGETVEKGTFSIFNGKIKTTSEDGKESVISYTYDQKMRELEIKDYQKAQ